MSGSSVGVRTGDRLGGEPGQIPPEERRHPTLPPQVPRRLPHRALPRVAGPQPHRHYLEWGRGALRGAAGDQAHEEVGEVGDEGGGG